jgi:hypothetical protein
MSRRLSQLCLSKTAGGQGAQGVISEQCAAGNCYQIYFSTPPQGVVCMEDRGAHRETVEASMLLNTDFTNLTEREGNVVHNVSRKGPGVRRYVLLSLLVREVEPLVATKCLTYRNLVCVLKTYAIIMAMSRRQRHVWPRAQVMASQRTMCMNS